MPYSWNALRFELPQGLVDQTIVTLADDPASPTFTLTLSSDDKSGQSFAHYVEAQIQDLARSLPGYKSVARKDERVNDRAAVLIEHRASSPQRQPMRQRQAYVDAGAVVAILTLTAADKPNPKADAAFDQVLRTLAQVH